MATHPRLATSRSPPMVTDAPLKFHRLTIEVASVAWTIGEHRENHFDPPVLLRWNYRCPMVYTRQEIYVYKILIGLRRNCGTSVSISGKLATELEHPDTKITEKIWILVIM